MKKAESDKVKEIHQAEVEKWGFHARHRRSPWILKITESIKYKYHVKDHEFDSERISLAKDGTVTIHASESRPYAWDGNTPKWEFGKKWFGKDQFIIGTPDGYRNILEDFPGNFPLTWKASLIHDAFYQYLHVIPIIKKEVDKIFRDILKEEKFFLWRLYYLAVCLLGGLRKDAKQRGLKGVYYKEYRHVYLARIGS